ncbi:3-phosphoshikimate 1-carboxyvinyltransferase [Bacteroidia bacterium]|nr:3-phosphoshikimate 1-carboxyvinyltransferase [Bacteroidia bacterium]
MRFLVAVCSVTQGNWIIFGDERLMKRPISDLIAALKKIGADIDVRERGIFIKGEKLVGGEIEIKADVSSQFISALMLIAPTMEQGLSISFEQKPVSFPYIKMTADLLEEAGVNVFLSEKALFVRGKLLNSCSFTVESDWSAASYFYALAALKKDIIIKMQNLSANSLQGDSIIAKWFEMFGIKTTFENDYCIASYDNEDYFLHDKYIDNNELLLNYERTDNDNVFTEKKDVINIDFAENPDLAQTFAVVCVALNKNAHLTNLKILKYKETDRLQALFVELKKIGANIEKTDRDFIIHKHSDLIFNEKILTYNDHRMAMSFAILKAISDEVEIDNAEVVSKSFPNFWLEFGKIFI